MKKIAEFQNKLDSYIKISKKICANAEAGQSKIYVLNKIFTYHEALKKIEIVHNQLKDLEKIDGIIYHLLANDFENDVYIQSNSNSNNSNGVEFSFLKKQYCELVSAQNHPVFKNYGNWEVIFIEDKQVYNDLLTDDFPFNDVKNSSGEIYKKFKNLLWIIFWFDNKLDILLSKNESFLTSVKEQLLENNKINEKLSSTKSEKLDLFVQFLENHDKINKTINNLNEVEIKGEKLIGDITLQNTEVATF